MSLTIVNPYQLTLMKQQQGENEGMTKVVARREEKRKEKVKRKRKEKREGKVREKVKVKEKMIAY